MDFISKIFDLDLSKFVPEMPVFLGLLRALLVIIILAGPILLVTLGVMYLLRPAPEANYKYGFRTYYGMGSVEAWKFSQKIAGLAYGLYKGITRGVSTLVAAPYSPTEITPSIVP